nr:MAG: hypothetical protein [Bacteriophage sp.]
MERLTYFKDGYWRVNFSGVQYQADFVDRLAAYEDTGLSPEKVSWMKEVVEAAFDNDTSRIERAHNLHVADKEGRVVVLPCKVGQRVFSLMDMDKHISECEVKRIGMGNKIGFIGLEPIGARGREYGVALNGFGKTVFLTREEAEKALAEMEGKA